MPDKDDKKNKNPKEKSYTLKDIENLINGTNQLKDGLGQAAEDVANISDILEKIGLPKKLLDNEVIKEVKGGLTTMLGTANELNKTFTGTRGRIVEIMDAAAQGANVISKLGGGAKDMSEIFSSVSEAARKNVVASTEDLSKLYAANRVLGTDYKSLVGSFLDVGVQFSKVGEQLEKSVYYVQSVGGNAKQVMQDVSNNMSKMNSYNFEGGVLGLTKMATQASLLRFDMSQTFALADKVMKPEGAIEMAAAFQRLGVAAGDLTDPFALMNKSINDPQGLQTSLINVAKQFAVFDDQSKTFKISPQGILTLREIQEQTGMSADAMSKAALAAADMDKKLSEISPSINIPEEDKQYLANIATMSKEGKYEVSLKDGTKAEIGALNQEQINDLIAEQKKPQKTLEELARDQMSLSEAFRNDFLSLKDKVLYGVINVSSVRSNLEGTRSFASISGALERSVPGPKGIQDRLSSEWEEAKRAQKSGSKNYLESFVKSAKDIGKSYMESFRQELKKEKLGDSDIEKLVKKLGDAYEKEFSGIKKDSDVTDDLGRDLYNRMLSALGASPSVGDAIIKKDGGIIRTSQDDHIYASKDEFKVKSKENKNKEGLDETIKTLDQKIKLFDNPETRGRNEEFISKDIHKGLESFRKDYLKSTQTSSKSLTEFMAKAVNVASQKEESSKFLDRPENNFKNDVNEKENADTNQSAKLTEVLGKVSENLKPQTPEIPYKPKETESKAIDGIDTTKFLDKFNDTLDTNRKIEPPVIPYRPKENEPKTIDVTDPIKLLDKFRNDLELNKNTEPPVVPYRPEEKDVNVKVNVDTPNTKDYRTNAIDNNRKIVEKPILDNKRDENFEIKAKIDYDKLTTSFTDAMNKSNLVKEKKEEPVKINTPLVEKPKQRINLYDKNDTTNKKVEESNKQNIIYQDKLKTDLPRDFEINKRNETNKVGGPPQITPTESILNPNALDFNKSVIGKIGGINNLVNTKITPNPITPATSTKVVESKTINNTTNNGTSKVEFGNLNINLSVTGAGNIDQKDLQKKLTDVFEGQDFRQYVAKTIKEQSKQIDKGVIVGNQYNGR